MNDLTLLGILFAIFFIFSLVEMVISLKRIKLLNFITALIFLLASLFALTAGKRLRIDPEVERQALSPHSISFTELTAGVYEYLDVVEITPFYLIPMRKVTINNKERKVGSKAPKWSFVVFSAEDYRLNNVPPKHNAPFGTFTGFLEVKGTSTNKVWSVVNMP